ncbi:ASPM protein, putative [Ixodes scapularis]|uniref:ASPM protein, putative n=1 Tax=Ixodes scapularis TaxID=6945 RepID=B7PBX5_IXOSC|nr:ASPM protein, putative [Ixodes scapularis]|eukprot:XP_002409027.1 ASPM protein, putative [Ixodes scapularis]
MADDKRGMCAMVFSPPSKQPNVAKASTSNVEVLLLQPFARTPQLCFEDVPVGAEASRFVKVRNVLDTASTVFIERVPRDKGFAVDPEVFRLTPGTEQLVNFLWKPADDGASCRSTVSVRSSQGYKGMLVLLATVKKSTERGPQGLQVGREEQHQGTCGRERKPGPDPGYDEGSVGARTRGRSFAFGWTPLLCCDGAELFSFRHDLRRGVCRKDEPSRLTTTMGHNLIVS